VVTFTLYDHHMAVDVGAPLEQIMRAAQAIGEEAEAEGEAQDGGEQQTAYALKPTAVSLLERGAQPFRVGDVYARAKENALSVTAWVRAKGLRLIPIRFAWQQVDNPEGASAFAQEVRARREVASHPGRFRGLMDYWVSWLLLGVLLLALFMPRGDPQREESEQQ
jgi:hypothetical protein